MMREQRREGRRNLWPGVDSGLPGPASEEHDDVGIGGGRVRLD